MSWCQQPCQELVGLTLGLPPFLLAAKLTKGLSMGRIPNELRQAIASNIRAARTKKFPNRGGSKQCAEAFSQFIGKKGSPQQWSP